MTTIVVGVDGSQESVEALRWAVGEARLRGATVEAVYAYQYTPAWERYAYGMDDVPVRPTEATRLRESIQHDAEAARERAILLVEQVIKELGDPGGVVIEPVAVEDRRPARALVERSSQADMLVVGSRGRGGFTGLLLGSVSQQCAHHAECPLVIISHQR